MKMVTELATNEPLVLMGPGTVKLKVAETVTVSAMPAAKGLVGGSYLLPSMKMGMASVVGPVAGFAVVLAGVYFLTGQMLDYQRRRRSEEAEQRPAAVASGAAVAASTEVAVATEETDVTAESVVLHEGSEGQDDRV
ncbi:MAG: hypothetical protein HQL50_07720 [Magnetococcales bacterium]|nr:hypothetical protein [Magnetococcales bacterium]